MNTNAYVAVEAFDIHSVLDRTHFRAYVSARAS